LRAAEQQLAATDRQQLASILAAERAARAAADQRRREECDASRARALQNLEAQRVELAAVAPAASSRLAAAGEVEAAASAAERQSHARAAETEQRAAAAAQIEFSAKQASAGFEARAMPRLCRREAQISNPEAQRGEELEVQTVLQQRVDILGQGIDSWKRIASLAEERRALPPRRSLALSGPPPPPLHRRPDRLTGFFVSAVGVLAQPRHFDMVAPSRPLAAPQPAAASEPALAPRAQPRPGPNCGAHRARAATRARIAAAGAPGGGVPPDRVDGVPRPGGGRKGKRSLSRSSDSMGGDARWRKGAMQSSTLDSPPSAVGFRECLQGARWRWARQASAASVVAARRDRRDIAEPEALAQKQRRRGDLDSTLAEAVLVIASVGLKRELLICREERSRMDLPLSGRCALCMAYCRCAVER
ncbi:unnamed protein product, partial [Prorocentrum cordatum]